MTNRFWIVLLALALFGAFLGLGRGDVVTDNEGQRASPPITMLRTGDFVTPMKNGEPYLVKPPLLYWAIAGVYAVAGVSEFAARTPTALAGVALVMCTYFLARKEAGERAARWGALALLTAPYVFERMRYAELDIPMALATFLSIARNATRTDSCGAARWYCLGSGLAFGAAVMLKGPVPFLFLWAGAIAVFITQSPQMNRIVAAGLRFSIAAFVIECALKLLAAAFPNAGTVLNFPVTLVVVMIGWTFFAVRYGEHRARWGYWIAAMFIGTMLFLPWGLAVLQRTGWENLSAMLQNQVVERTHVASAINGGWPWYYITALGVTLAPWGLLLPFHFSKREWTRQNQLYRFSVVMAWLSVLIFSLIAGKEHEYLLPCAPFMMLATGYHIAQIGQGIQARWMETWASYWQVIVLALFAIALPAVALYCTLRFESYSFLAIIWGLTLIGFAACLVARRSRTYRNAAIFTATLCAALIYLNGRGEMNQGLRSPRELARMSAEYVESGYTVQTSEAYPAFEFYARMPLALERSPERVRERFAGAEPYLYVTREGRLSLAGLNDYTVYAGPIDFKELMLIGNHTVPDE